MKVKWEDFARRRKLDLQIFVENMKYEKYVQWCKQRSVVPIDKLEYKVPDKPVVTPDPVETPSEPDWKKIKKSVKADIQKLCTEMEVEFTSSDTKKTLIEKLKLSYDR